jgi:hypothetical protein
MDHLMPAPYTIRIFVADGDPDAIRIIDRFNWTGKGFFFPRKKWSDIRKRPEFDFALLPSTCLEHLPDRREVGRHLAGGKRCRGRVEIVSSAPLRSGPG